MRYEIISAEDDSIHIIHDYRDQLDGFIMLIKSIEGELDGRILQLDGDEIRYVIDNDPYDLTYCWVASEGNAEIVVNLKDPSDMDEVREMLERHFDRLSI